MPLKMMLFTNNEAIAATADSCGVDRIVVDLEILGKNERQGHLNTRISAHSLEDVRKIRSVISQAELLVRINPIHDGTEAEINAVIAAGADILMLPYFNTLAEIQIFLQLVAGRAKTILLLETAQAEAIVDDIIALGGFDSIHIGINDLAISKGLSFLFESLLEPSFENLCSKLRLAGIPFGFGGITRLNEGKVAARYVIPEHYRLGSSQIILGRSFLSAEEIAADLDKAKRLLADSVAEVRAYEAEIVTKPAAFFEENSHHLHRLISEIATEIRRKRG
jgi:hypothetical protein